MWRKIRINRTTALDRLKIVSYLTSAKPEGKLAVIAPPKSSVCLNSVAILGFDVENLKINAAGYSNPNTLSRNFGT